MHIPIVRIILPITHTTSINTLHHPRCPHESIHASSTNSTCDDLQVLSKSQDSPRFSRSTLADTPQCHSMSLLWGFRTEELPKQEIAPGRKIDKIWCRYQTATKRLYRLKYSDESLRIIDIFSPPRKQMAKRLPGHVCMMEFCHQEPTKHNELLYNLHIYTNSKMNWDHSFWEDLPDHPPCTHHLLICPSKIRLQKTSNEQLWYLHQGWLFDLCRLGLRWS